MTEQLNTTAPENTDNTVGQELPAESGQATEQTVEQAAPATGNQSNVTIKVINSSGEELMKFPASKTGSIAEDAEKAGFEIPVSCGAGACYFCAGHVKSGMEYVDIGKMGVPLVDLEEDQILTCVGGVKEQYFSDGQEHEIVIEKDI